MTLSVEKPPEIASIPLFRSVAVSLLRAVSGLPLKTRAYCTVRVAEPLTFPAVAVMVTVPVAMARPTP